MTHPIQQRDTLFLLVDIGNSTVEFAPCDSTCMHRYPSTRLPTSTLIHSLPTLGWHQYQRVIVSSVVPSLDSHLSQWCTPYFVTAATIPYLKLGPVNASQVGADRLVNALAAYAITQKTTLVIDSGTATTFCLVSDEGVYQGGAIFPGMGISAQALHAYTAKIPLVTVSPVTSLVGTTTEEAVKIGLYQGFLAMINGMIHAYRLAYPSVYVIGTGKGLEELYPQLTLDAFDPELILKGLQICAQNLPEYFGDEKIQP